MSEVIPLSPFVSCTCRCFRVTSLPWYQRKAAGLLGTLPNSTYEEAISFFEASEAANPKAFPPNWLYLAKCHMQLKNWAEAKKWLTKILEEDDNPKDPDCIEVTFDLLSYTITYYTRSELALLAHSFIYVYPSNTHCMR